MSTLKQVIKYANANAIEATWVDGEDVVRCHSYDGSQMQMFRDDVVQYGGDIAEYEALIAEVVAAYDPPPILEIVPVAVSRFQARAALMLAGLLDDVEALMAAPGTPALAKLAWEDAQEFKRSSPTVLAMSSALGMTEAQLDELFTTAAGIDA